MESFLVSPKLLWLVVLLGVVVRVRQYAANRSLWLDESLVALNIIGRGMHRLLTAPLDFNQTAPAGFLFVEKLSAQLFDKGEYALRAFPFLCGIVGLLLYPKLALRVVGPAGAVIAVALFAFSEPLIYYSSELKPYAGDIAATFAIALVGLATLDHRLSIRWAVAYGFLGFVLIQLTYAGILAAAGTGAALITIFLLDRRWAHPGSIIVLVGSWAVGAAVFILSRPGIDTSQFARGHGSSVRGSSGQGSFAPFPASKPDFKWYLSRVKEVVGDANFLLSRWAVFLVVILAIAGAVNLLGRNWRLFAVLVAPVIATVAASSAHKYPMFPRTMLFFVPLLLLLIANGIVVLARRLPVAVGATAAAFVVAGLLAEVSFAGPYSIAQPVHREEIKQSLTYVGRHWRAGDVLYLQYGSQYAFAYYSECACFRLPGDRKLRSIWPVRRIVVQRSSDQFARALISQGSSLIVGETFGAAADAPVYAGDASSIARHRRAWILVTWHNGVRELNLIENELLGRLDRRGRRVTSLSRGGTHLYLYRFPMG